MAVFYETLRDGLMEGCKLPPEEAERLAVRLIEWGAATGHGGNEHYWPMRLRKMSISERNAAIRREFDGTNLKPVCQRYEVSHTTVYNIVRGNL